MTENHRSSAPFNGLWLLDRQFFLSPERNSHWYRLTLTPFFPVGPIICCGEKNKSQARAQNTKEMTGTVFLHPWQVLQGILSDPHLPLTQVARSVPGRTTADVRPDTRYDIIFKSSNIHLCQQFIKTISAHELIFKAKYNLKQNRRIS